jgi:hypothetical protein
MLVNLALREAAFALALTSRQPFSPRPHGGIYEQY